MNRSDTRVGENNVFGFTYSVTITRRERKDCYKQIVKCLRLLCA